MWGLHGFVTDNEGILYTAEVRTGRVQKYTPRKGANPEFLVGKPWGADFELRQRDTSITSKSLREACAVPEISSRTTTARSAVEQLSKAKISACLVSFLGLVCLCSLFKLD